MQLKRVLKILILSSQKRKNHEAQELNMTAIRNNKEHTTKIGMKTMSILGKSGACFSPKQGMLGSNLL